MKRIEDDKNKNGGVVVELCPGCYSRSICIPISSTSARIFTTLYDNKSINILEMLKLLQPDAEILVNDWIILLTRISEDTTITSEIKLLTIQILWRNGVRKNVYQDYLYMSIINHGNVSSLEASLFHRDINTGIAEPIVNMYNIDLMKQLTRREYSPNIRVVCAIFATEIRDYDIAQAVCIELLTEDYDGMNNPDETPTDEDRHLAWARDAAMVLMFYGIRNERMFHTIYDRSIIVETQMEEHGEDLTPQKLIDSKMKWGWVRFDLYVLGAMEVERAKSLINQIRRKSKED